MLTPELSNCLDPTSLSPRPATQSTPLEAKQVSASCQGGVCLPGTVASTKVRLTSMRQRGYHDSSPSAVLSGAHLSGQKSPPESQNCLAAHKVSCQGGVCCLAQLLPPKSRLWRRSQEFADVLFERVYSISSHVFQFQHEYLFTSLHSTQFIINLSFETCIIVTLIFIWLFDN